MTLIETHICYFIQNNMKNMNSGINSFLNNAKVGRFCDRQRREKRRNKIISCFYNERMFYKVTNKIKYNHQ